MKKRKLKVTEATDTIVKNVPCIKLQGRWLKKLGYKVGDEVIVANLRGWLLITPAEENESRG